MKQAGFFNVSERRKKRVKTRDFVARANRFAENALFLARLAEREATLGLPAKTPNNSSTPPSQGRKASDDAANNFFNDMRCVRKSCA
jgi:hypothetical protein